MRRFLLFVPLFYMLACGFLASPWPSYGGINHGLDTTFHCSSWGGAPCACFMSAASGKCGDATAHYSNATCNGGDDSAALADWIAYGHSISPALVVLNIPHGCIEGNFGGDGNASFSGDIAIHCAGFGTQPDTTIQNAVIWGYGTTFHSIWFGGEGFFNFQNTPGNEAGCESGPTNTSPLIQAANAGDTTITLVSPSDATGNLSVGADIAITALANEIVGSFPPSHTFHEYKKIISIDLVTGKIGLNSPLLYSYKTTYPNIGGASPFQGGPATIYLMEKTYATNSQYFGMTVTTNGQTTILGKSITLTDVKWTDPSANPAPTQSETIKLIRIGFPNMEADKDIDTLSITDSAIGNIGVQSSSINNFSIDRSTFGNQGSSGFINGTSANVSISNTTFPNGQGIRPGPLCCGQANSLSLNNVRFDLAATNLHFTAISAYSFSGGTLTIAKSDPEWSGVNAKGPGIWVPGHKYFMGDSAGFNSCSVPNTFTAIDVQDAGANVNIITDISSIPITNICEGVPTSTFGSYNVMTFSVTNSGPGNMLSNLEFKAP